MSIYCKSLHKTLPSTTSYYKACTKHFPVLLRTTKLAQSTSQYYFVYCKACKKYFAVLLCSTKLAQSKYFPVLLCTTKLAQTTSQYYFQTTSQYYFLLQSLHKALPSTTLYYWACAKYFPALLCTTELAQSTSQYYFVLQTLDKARPSSITLWNKVGTKKAFTHSKLFRREAFTHSKLFKQACAKKAFTHSKSGRAIPTIPWYPHICGYLAPHVFAIPADGFQGSVSLL